VYIPEQFRQPERERIVTFIQEQSFAILVSQYESVPMGTHLPLLLRPEPEPWGTLVGHMARANPQWRSFDDGREVLAIFHGPQAYISPSWYDVAPAVPTWNYVAVHAYGKPRAVEDSEELRAILAETVQTYEGGFAQPWRLEDQPEEFVDRMLRAVVGFKIRLTRVEGKAKLGQNRSEGDRRGVVSALRANGDADGREVAALMGEQLLTTSP